MISIRTIGAITDDGGRFMGVACVAGHSVLIRSAAAMVSYSRYRADEAVVFGRKGT